MTQATATKAAVLRDVGGDFLIEDVTLAAPAAGEVLVRIVGVGLCHTDVAVRSGTLPLPLPLVLGHEGSGVVEQVGEGVTHVAPGDHVVLTFGSCGQCAPCGSHAPAHCENFNPMNFAGGRLDGTPTMTRDGARVGAAFFGQSSFAGHALASARNTIKVDPDLPIALLGPLGCGVQTGAGAVMRSLACPAGSSLLVIGGGSVGLSAVMGGVLQGCATIILVEPHAARRALAVELGATHVIDPGATPMAEAVRGICPAGVNFAVDTTGLPAVVADAIGCLAPQGTCGLVGVPNDMAATAPLPLSAIVGSSWTVRGIIEGDSDPEVFIPELIAHHRAGRFPFDRLITTYPFDAINQAVADQHAGLCIKPVLLTGETL